MQASLRASAAAAAAAKATTAPRLAVVTASAAGDAAAAAAPDAPPVRPPQRRNNTSTASRRSSSSSSTASKAPQGQGQQKQQKQQQRPPRRSTTTASTTASTTATTSGGGGGGGKPAASSPPRRPRPSAPAKKPATAAAAGSGLSAAPLGGRLPPAYGSSANMPSWQKGRRAGVILHPTSLPGGLGVGDLGPEAFSFVDWLRSAGAQLWQVLPLVPPDPEFFSPYSGLDANCGNPLLVSCDALATEGLLSPEDVAAARAELLELAADKAQKVSAAAASSSSSAAAEVDFAAVAAVKGPLLAKAARALLSGPRFQQLRDLGFRRWRRAHPWVEDSALFDCLRRRPDLAGKAWWEWPADLRFRCEPAMQEARAAHRCAIDEFAAVQFLFDRQWAALKAYANSRGVGIVGDMPIYVGGMSADVWANPSLFELDAKTLAPKAVSGVPPDAFSATGQLWGSPLYRWPAHAQEGYAWWSSRMARHMQLFDETRVDHFRAFAGYWSVRAGSETAMGGEWRKGPGKALFDALERRLGRVPILAEDLGVITTDVVELREAIGAPGMVVLQFAWGGGSNNVHLPHMHYENAFCYVGTHDNETALGWWQDGSANAQDRAYLEAYLGEDAARDVPGAFLRSAMSSVARTSIVMMQDVLRLGNEARMNTPGRAEGNWAWRVTAPRSAAPGGEHEGEAAAVGAVWGAYAAEARELRELAHVYDRLAKGERYEATAAENVMGREDD